MQRPYGGVGCPAWLSSSLWCRAPSWKLTAKLSRLAATRCCTVPTSAQYALAPDVERDLANGDRYGVVVTAEDMAEARSRITTALGLGEAETAGWTVFRREATF